MLGVLVVLLGVVIIAMVVRVPYFSEGPGPAHDVLPLIDVEGAKTFPADGRLMLTTVSFSADRLTAFQYLLTWLDPDEDLIPERDLLAPGQTLEEESALQDYAMDRSQLTATSVALHAIGVYPEQRGSGALIEGTVPGCEADGQLFPGNLITAIDGETVDGEREARALIDRVPPDQPIEFVAKAGKKDVVVDLRRTPCGPDGEDLVGVSVMDPFPFEVRIDDAGVGGPSAGLMFSLGIYDTLTPGDLTGGLAVAGTGEIDRLGTVYPIGGIGKKLQGAEEAGAEVFLVPRGNLEEARKAGVEGLRLIPVGTFDEAVEALGGDTVASAEGEE